MTDLATVARAFVEADEAVRDARNGQGHPGEGHDRDLNPFTGYPDFGNLVGDCARCGGAQYGAEDARNTAMGDLREALGMERRPWER